MAAEHGSDPNRNGEPFGELGIVLNPDAAWQDQNAGPRDPQPGNVPGVKLDVQRSAGTKRLDAQPPLVIGQAATIQSTSSTKSTSGTSTTSTSTSSSASTTKKKGSNKHAVDVSVLASAFSTGGTAGIADSPATRVVVSPADARGMAISHVSGADGASAAGVIRSGQRRGDSRRPPRERGGICAPRRFGCSAPRAPAHRERRLRRAGRALRRVRARGMSSPIANLGRRWARRRPPRDHEGFG
jgi:hypothetical protein